MWPKTNSWTKSMLWVKCTWWHLSLPLQSRVCKPKLWVFTPLTTKMISPLGSKAMLCHQFKVPIFQSGRRSLVQVLCHMDFRLSLSTSMVGLLITLLPYLATTVLLSQHSGMQKKQISTPIMKVLWRFMDQRQYNQFLLVKQLSLFVILPNGLGSHTLILRIRIALTGFVKMFATFSTLIWFLLWEQLMSNKTTLSLQDSSNISTLTWKLTVVTPHTNFMHLFPWIPTIWSLWQHLSLMIQLKFT